MSSWLSKAANVFQPDVPDQPQVFELECSCGERQRGFRREHHQRIVCKVCGTALFVLPRNVYPASGPVVSKREKAAEVAAPLDAVEDELIAVSLDEDLPVSAEVLDEDATPPTKSKRGPAEKLPTLAELRQRMREAQKPRPPAPTSPAVPEKTNPLQEVGQAVGELGRETTLQIVRFWTPFRLLAAGVLVVLMVTGGWMYWQSLQSQAVKIAKQESELGLAAIDDQHWMVAREHLQRAAAALDRLGRTDPESQAVRQYARETQAQFRLCDLTLAELLEKAQAELQSRNVRDKRTDQLLNAYQGDFLVLEGTVRDVSPRKQGPRQFAMVFPVNPAGGAGKVTIRMDFASLNQLIPAGGEKQLIVAGALANCERQPTGDWTITLDAESGFLWTHLNTYQAAGFDFHPLRTRETVEAELGEQARAQGVPE